MAKKILILAAAIVMIAGCEESRNPVDSIPDGTASRVYGNIMDPERMEQIPVILRGNDNDYFSVTYGDGNPNYGTSGEGDYSFEDIPFGKYAIIPGSDEYKFYPENTEITVDADVVQAPIIIGYKMPVTGRLLMGYFKGLNGIGCGEDVYDGNIPYYSNKRASRTVNGLRAYSMYIDDESIDCLTMKFRLFPREPITPYQPDSVVVKLDSRVVFQDVEFTFEEWPRYIVSGVVLSRYDVEGISVTLCPLYNTSESLPIVDGDGYSVLVSSNGAFVFNGVLGGEYLLEFEDGLYETADAESLLTVKSDIHLDPMPILYHGATTMTIRGRVIDDFGIGVSGVTVSRLNELNIPVVQDITDSEGIYELTVTIAPDKTLISKIQVAKTGVAFDPAVKTIAIPWEIDIQESEIDGPLFTGTDYTALSAGDFFPFDTISRWSYSRVSGNTTSGVELTISDIGDGWYRFSPRGPADFQEFGISGNNVTVRDTDGSPGTLLKFGLIPGTTWKVFPDQEYQVWNGTFLGLEDVTVPAGTFECAVFEAGIAWGSQSDTTYTLWFAREIGLVKMTRISRSGGELVEARTDELVTFDIIGRM